MTEQQESQVKPQPTAAVNGSKSRSGAVLGGVAILLALGLTGGLYLHGHKNAVAQQAELAQLKQQLASALSKIDQTSSKDAEQLAALDQTQQRLQGEMQGLQNRVLDLNDKRPNDWMLAESEYLVRMAGRKLWLEHDLVSAITLLGNADERIAALNDPSLMPIRKALAEDIAKLKGMPRIDREGLTLKLAALSDQIELLPLSTVSMPEAKAEPDQAVSTNPDEWESNLKKNWVKFTENFVTIRRRDGAVEALLSPQQEIFLRENLKTKLLQAQLSVYREQQALYEDSLDKAQRWLTQYFDTDNSATRYMQGEIDKLKGEQIQIDYPAQFKTQAMLEQVLTERLQRILASS
ncbi:MULTISPECIES: uroporphyrinogen-III C-methyltransferase [Aeromonas]|jgi:uroporphyrin-3 C-methyltransferase|uniref:Heme biosynthesis operon protein HemX n=2 Tax=Aeromonas veronii TaxID=654 RepID=A0A4S5CMD6_AERVE|nr:MULTISPECIES: uroporphyrinogen-III C-methyltransferase [Aeromonas]MCR6551559.1 uroporphyrinogen-III C-methyltransferase [Aeromonas sp. CPF2-S1]HDN9001637.1 uroporphyrinogen-III C-methyltransferase [Aeromonas veronii AMC24]AEB48311.1 Uroporphyrin-III C-methyltransferase [Aeromonas veronii B565]ANB67664.1 heme biosynthesis operon protein HemX [Aeromonas veronii]ATY75990.1 heme biosynthesis operon protein HemX [Aeromonas veronii]